MNTSDKIFNFFGIFVPAKLKPLYFEKIGKEKILYIFIGALTTLISWVTFWAAEVVLGEGLSLVSNIFSFVCAIAFAYPANRVLVFESRATSLKDIASEFTYFVIMRLASFGFEELAIAVFVNYLDFPSMPVKIVASVIVVILNYFFSKLVIFKKNPQKGNSNGRK